MAAFANQPAYTGTTGGWVLASFDLSPYFERFIKVRWQFKSDNSISWYPGWYIDDVALWGCRVPQYGVVTGQVLDQNGEPIPEARLSAGRSFMIADEEGFYALFNVIAGNTRIVASKPGIPDTEIRIDIEPNDFINLNIEMQRPIFDVNPNQFDWVMGPGMRFTVDLDLTNQSGFPIPYNIRLLQPELERDAENQRGIRSLNSANPKRDDPLDEIFRIELTANTGYQRILGAQYANSRFYLTSGDQLRGNSFITLNSMGQFISATRQPENPVGWGYRDMTWDGTNLYVSQNQFVSVLNEVGELQSRFRGAPLAVNRALTYDIERDAFWATDWDNAWYLFDRDENELFNWAGHGLNSVLGFAYHPDDDEGMFLYAFNLEQDGNTGIYRSNPFEEQIELLHTIEGAPNGGFITGDYDGSRWLLGIVVGTQQQHLVGIELGNRSGWLTVDPMEGEFAVDQSIHHQVNVTIPENAEYDTFLEAIISIRGFNGEMIGIPLTVEVSETYQHFGRPPVSEHFHTIRVEEMTFADGEFPVGSEVGVFTPRGQFGGALRWTQEPSDIRAYFGENSFRNGDSIYFKVWDYAADLERDFDVELLEGHLIFVVGAESRINIDVSDTILQNVFLTQGWNLVSILVDPRNKNTEHLFANLLENDRLIIMKDNIGRFWVPEHDYNGIRTWNVKEGYLVSVTQSDSLLIAGVPIPFNTPIPLALNWNTVANYLPNVIEARTAFSNIIDVIEIAKDGFGRFMVPSLGFYGMGNVMPGQGYKLKTTEEAQLIYSMGQMLADSKSEMDVGIPVTGKDMSVLITSLPSHYLENGYELQVFSGVSGQLVGKSKVESLPLGVIVRGKEDTDLNSIGADENEALRFAIVKDNIETPLASKALEITKYNTDEFVILELQDDAVNLPEVFTLNKVYPNPFNNNAVVYFGLPEASNVSIVIRDVQGRVVQKSALTSLQAGNHVFNIIANGWSSGVYFIELSNEKQRLNSKILLLR